MSVFSRFFGLASGSTSSASQETAMAAKSFVESTVAENSIVVFSKTWCPYCKRTKALFKSNFPDEKRIFVELDERDDGDAIQQYIASQNHHSTVPMVFINQQFIGGNDATQAAMRSGKLQQLLQTSQL